MSSLADLSIAAAAAGMREGTFRAVELLEAVLLRATFTEAQLHAYLNLDREGARAAAEAVDQSRAAGKETGPLAGIPIALKDNMVTRGLETTCSSKILAGYIPPYDATVVERLRQAGAVIVGKTNLDEFAMGSSTENSAYGPSRNPWDPERVPGGSSGGSAATVAAGSALGALGSDTGGSIRQPAALCGVVGMKPTYGRVSRYGLIAFASSLDQIGPITRTVEDAATLLSVIAGPDPHDSTSYPHPPPDFRSRLGRGVEGVRIGVVREFMGEGIDPQVLAASQETLDRLSQQGAILSEVSLPTCEHALSAYYLIAPAECSANLARFDGVRYGLRIAGSNTEEMMANSRAQGFGPEVTRRILLGTYALSAGYYEAFYIKAQQVRTLLIEEFRRAYAEVDVLVSPTSPTTAFPIGAKAADPLAMYLSDVCTIPSNLAGDPAISVPVGLDREGLPIGLQLMAPPLQEELLFQVASAVEAVASFQARPGLAVSEAAE